jgi:acyl-CoA thioester hydrolase
MGVVYHANYLVWMEIGRVELVRSLGCDYGEIEAREGLYLAVMEANCRYLAPARYDQEITVQTQLLPSTSRVMHFGYEIRAAEPTKVLVEGWTKHVWVNRAWRPARLPEQYCTRLGIKSREAVRT